MSATQPLGKAGEDLAAEFLESKGLRIVDRHFQTRWGEIDVIARDGATWIFVEVKLRTRKSTPSAADVITRSKQKKIVQAALMYMKMKRLEGQSMRFDAILIEAGEITWLDGAFDPQDVYTF